MGQRNLHRQLNQVRRQTARLKQMQIALHQSKCRMADAVRRGRTKHIIEQGGLTVIVDLLHFDRDVLFGALLRAAQHLNDPAMVGKWQAIGRRKFVEWRQSGKDVTLPVIPKSEQTNDPGKDRKRMTRQLCELGGLIDKAEFAEVDRAVLLGILSEIARCRNNAVALTAWKQAAVDAAAEKAAAEAAARAHIQPVVVKFPGTIPQPVAARLRELGLAFNRDKCWWTGDADPSVISRVASPAGGEVFVPEARPP